MAAKIELKFGNLTMDEITISHHIRKPTNCICENRGADQRLCFHYMDSTIPLLHKSEFQASSLII